MVTDSPWQDARPAGKAKAKAKSAAKATAEVKASTSTSSKSAKRKILSTGTILWKEDVKVPGLEGGKSGKKKAAGKKKPKPRAARHGAKKGRPI